MESRCYALDSDNEQSQVDLMKQQIEPDCPFCNARDKAFAQSESRRFLALYNIAPILPGHSLIVPKWHVKTFDDLSNKETIELVLFSRKCMEFLKKEFRADGFNWTIQEGLSGGQTVRHFHLHLIPRHTADLKSPGDWYPRLLEWYSDSNIDSAERPRHTTEEIKVIVDKLRQAYLDFD
jgi:bis(5'-adenosyl)-triphosphatase